MKSLILPTRLPAGAVLLQTVYTINRAGWSIDIEGHALDGWSFTTQRRRGRVLSDIIEQDSMFATFEEAMKEANAAVIRFTGTNPCPTCHRPRSKGKR